MPRAGLSPTKVVDEAAVLADEVGLSELTLAELAARLGVRLPSLYKHIDGMPALQRELAIRSKRELTDVLSKAAVGKSRGDALIGVAQAYRRWASEHPGAYDASTRAPTEGDVDDAEASAAAVRVVFDVLAGYGLSGAAMIDATRTLRAGLHGFVTLERAAGFALDRSVDASFDWFLDSLDKAMSAST